MPERCRCCYHNQRKELDQALLSGVPVGKVAQDFGVSVQSVKRHLKNHVSKFLQSVGRRVAELEADQILGQLAQLYERSVELLDDAERGGHGPRGIRDRAAALREVRSTIELMARLAWSQAAQAPQPVDVTIEDDGRPDLDDEIERALARRGMPAQGPRADEEPEVVEAEPVDDDPPQPALLALPPAPMA